jgi:hypothetical protein
MGYAYPIDSKVVTNPNGTVDYDRASSSAQLRGLIKSMITNGVNLTESTNLQVMADEETMNLIVKPGYVIIEGALKHFEDDVKVTIGAADTTNPRIDTVVARLNLNEDVRDIVIDVLQGTPSAEPTAPELTRTTSYYEVGLADILVEVGATQISQAVVTDTRLLNSRCGLATSIGEIDTETLFVQLTTDFDNWFESIKGKLGDDVAGGLQLQINGLADDIDTLQEDVEALEENLTTLESGLASERLLWNISDDTYYEETKLDIPKTTYQSPTIRDIAFYDDNKLSLLYYNSTTDVKRLDFDGTTWSESNFGYAQSQQFSMFYYEGYYYSISVAGSTMYIRKIDPATNAVASGTSVITLTYNGYGTVIQRQGYNLFIANAIDTTVYLSRINLTQWNLAVNGKSISLGSTKCNLNDFTLLDGKKYSLKFKSYDSALGMQLIYHENNSRQEWLYGIPYLGGGFRKKITLGEKEYLIESSSTTQHSLYESGRDTLKVVPLTDNIRACCEYNNSLYGMYNDGYFYKIRPYKIATSYATKGTKIISPNSFTISDNLEAIDNGFLVTESGEIKIGIYE